MVKATYTAEEFHGLKIEETLEGLCHEAVWRYVNLRNFASAMSRKVHFIFEGQIWTIKGNLNKEPFICDHIAKNHPNAEILNDLSIEEAFEKAAPILS